MYKIIKYEHHGKDVFVRDDLKGKHRSYCLCHQKCKKFQPGKFNNCFITQSVFENCKKFNIVTPIWECPFYEYDDSRDLTKEEYHLASAIECYKPIPKSILEESYKKGVLSKDKLEDGKYYLGECRNARVARWCEKDQKFTYIRTKFGSSYPEDIKHPEDDDGFDLFVPFREIEPYDNEKIEKYEKE